MRAVDVLASVVDAAFPLLRTDTDFCPSCYLPSTVFPMFPLLDVQVYSNQEQKDDHV